MRHPNGRKVKIKKKYCLIPKQCDNCKAVFSREYYWKVKFHEWKDFYWKYHSTKTICQRCAPKEEMLDPYWKNGCWYSDTYVRIVNPKPTTPREEVKQTEIEKTKSTIEKLESQIKEGNKINAEEYLMKQIKTLG